MAEVDDILKRLGPSKPALEADEPDDSDAGLTAAADELIAAVEAKDSAGVVSALRSAFEMLNAAPVEMGED